jgi:hypothetical protein
LKVVLLAYFRGLISSRKIEPACRKNVVLIALACGQQPDHSTQKTIFCHSGAANFSSKAAKIFHSAALHAE